ncbi:hypothetical protein JRI60_24000 [Archangium violaceum]|uniref:hypothetical protein n=1 Tax=Archangium violaceum TaxID=83451 RepID=UPI00194DE954|nr:hypothetical protein [Archangium violaceum]QRO01860.1 hypothetical protein JRI60_24000 [Archangium violaceum]
MRHPSGKVSLGALFALAVVAGVIYAGVMFVPFYVDHLDVKEAVAVAHNLSGRNYNDAMLRNVIRERTGQLGSHWERDQFDRDVLMPGLGLNDEQILIERSDVTQNVRIEVSYERTVRLKPTNAVRTLHFSAVKEGIPE